MDFADQALKMAGALAVVVSLLLGGMFVLKRLMGESQGYLSQSILRMLGGLRLGQGKTIMLVEVAGEVLVLGSTARELTLLTRISDQERVKQLRTTSGNAIERLRLLPGGLWRRAENLSPPLQEKEKLSDLPLSAN